MTDGECGRRASRVRSVYEEEERPGDACNRKHTPDWPSPNHDLHQDSPIGVEPALGYDGQTGPLLSMKRVLVLAYYFPPLGGAGVQRTVKLLKHLPRLGYEAIVVTGPSDASIEWAPPDPSLEDDVAGVTVRRARSRRSRLRDSPRAARWLLASSPRDRWWHAEALRLGRPLLDDVDLVYASMSPFVSASTACCLGREGKKPWVADLRDPWALDEWTQYPTALHRVVDARRMRRVLGEADAVVMNTGEAARALLREFPEISPRAVVTIPNGWDRDDFASRVPARHDGKFRVVLTGYTHDAASGSGPIGSFRRFLGGRTSGLDVRGRSHEYLAQALELLRELDGELADRTELHIAGAAPPGRGEPSNVDLHHHGYLPHDEALALMRSADVLFLPMHDLPVGLRSRTVPGKTYEYLAAGRPILAALPDGDARDLLASLPNVWVCRPTDVVAMARALQEIAALRPAPARPLETIASFERGYLAERMAQVFDGVLLASSPR